MKYELITYDVWGNAREGFWVNDAHHSGVFIDLPEDASDYLINRRLRARGVEWEGDPEDSLYGNNKRNGKPVAELRSVDL